MSVSTLHEELYREALESLDCPPAAPAPSTTLRRVRIAAVALVAWPVLEIVSNLAAWLLVVL